ncbi:hypothetical protein LTR84_000384 [Exophiala bonariae]|uniref:Transcription factor domain-containing protein n=1 Tax=Exophiala bonariae TaxID=1690606 RepID=A0AAV9NQD8_9EURO|nr:hypothetical protein LTR84_000384 [Exophiala bonariae]
MADQEDRGGPGGSEPGQPQPSSSSSPRPPAYTGPFLFVNKNATNLRTRQRDEVFAVRSHAMQIARRSRKQNKEDPVQPMHENMPEEVDQAQHGEIEGPEQRPSTRRTERRAIGQGQSVSRTQAWRSQRPSTAQPHPTTSRRTSSQLQPGGISSATRDQADATAATSLSQILASITRHAVGSAPSTPLGSGPSDPFSAAALPISAFFNSLLQFWRLGYMANLWPAAVYMDPSHEVPQLVDGWIRDVVTPNPAMLHGLFAGTLSFITSYLPASEATPVLWARGMHHHGKCLEFTRSRLTMPNVNGEEALGMIHQSTTFSFHCGDFDASSVHRVASARILDTLENGLDSVHPVLKSLLIICDTLIAMHKPKRPSLDIESWTPGSWHDEDMLRPYDDEFDFDPSDYSQSDRQVLLFREQIYDSETGDIAIQVQGMINLQREALCACEIAARLTISEGVASADPIYHWLAFRHYALASRCANLYMDMVENEPEPHTAPLPEHLQSVFPSCILLATSYTFQLIMRCSMGGWSLSYIPFHHLRNRLTLMMTLMGEGRRMQLQEMMHIPTETLLFLFFGGAVAEEIMEQHVRSSPVESGQYAAISSTAAPANLLHLRWFSVHFCMVLQRLGITDWEAAKHMLTKFVYDERTMDGHVQVLVAKRSEFLGVLSVGGRGRSEVPQSASQVGGSLLVSRRNSLGQQSGGAVADSSPQHFPQHSRSESQQSVPAIPPVSALSPITGPDFAAGFWEHMGLGMDLDADEEENEDGGEQWSNLIRET